MDSKQSSENYKRDYEILSGERHEDKLRNENHISALRASLEKEVNASKLELEKWKIAYRKVINQKKWPEITRLTFCLLHLVIK